MRSPWKKPDDPKVELDLYKSLTIDLRARPAPSEEIRECIQAHKERRKRECQKVEPAIEYPDWRLEELAHKYAPADAYEADEVCDE